MRTEDKERINQRYAERLAKYGATVESLALGGKERQYLRFDVLCGVSDLNGKSILDVGCGFGDLVAFLEERGIRFKEYVGVDINPELIAEAERRHGTKENVRFAVQDVTEEGFDERFDIVVAGSVFNNRLSEENMQFIERILPRLFRIAKEGVAINFMTDYVDFKSPDVYHYSPEKVFAVCKRLTKRVALRHDYPLYDFAVYLYPDFTPWRAP